MSRAVKRYPLILYTHTLNRWWPALLALSFALFGLAWALYVWPMETWRWLTSANLGGLILLFALLIFAIRASAFVQPMDTHLRLVTPFLRLNISYKRLRRTKSAMMSSLFPPKSVSSWGREFLKPLSKETAIVIELNDYPVSPLLLRSFLSPYFFKDKTPHLVLLVEDWMSLSTELESLKVVGLSAGSPARTKDPSILTRLSHK